MGLPRQLSPAASIHHIIYIYIYMYIRVYGLGFRSLGCCLTKTPVPIRHDLFGVRRQRWPTFRGRLAFILGTTAEHPTAGKRKTTWSESHS